jgi:riboflavin biosynthesis pyrimidine reductase
MPRPWVLAHNVASLDGRLTIAPGVLLLQGDERWSAVVGDSDPYVALRQEFSPDAILEGSGSFVVDGVAPVDQPHDPAGDHPDLAHDFLPEHVVRRPSHQGWFTVVDGRGRVRWQYKEFPDPAWGGWHLLVLACGATPARYLADLHSQGIPYLVVGESRIDLAAALERLAGRLGVRRVLATGGGRLQGELLRQGLIDEVSLELAPTLIGGEATPALFDGRPLAAGEWPTRLRLNDVRVENGRVIIRAVVVGHERDPVGHGP